MMDMGSGVQGGCRFLCRLSGYEHSKLLYLENVILVSEETVSSKVPVNLKVSLTSAGAITIVANTVIWVGSEKMSVLPTMQKNWFCSVTYWFTHPLWAVVMPRIAKSNVAKSVCFILLS